MGACPQYCYKIGFYFTAIHVIMMSEDAVLFARRQLKHSVASAYSPLAQMCWCVWQVAGGMNGERLPLASGAHGFTAMPLHVSGRGHTCSSYLGLAVCINQRCARCQILERLGDMLSASVALVANACQSCAQLPADLHEGVKYDSLICASSCWLRHYVTSISFHVFADGHSHA
jgi:hypothetical protein